MVLPGFVGGFAWFCWWFWVVVAGFGWFWVVLGGFGWFRILVTTFIQALRTVVHENVREEVFQMCCSWFLDVF